MVNYDLPWNPNRIEQRFGRIHRIGQTEVCHLWNMLAEETREGDVFKRLLFACLVDDPSSHPDTFATEKAQDDERQRLFRIIEDLAKWENSDNEFVLNAARTEIRKSVGKNPPPILDPFCGGGSVPLEAKALIEIPPRFAGQPPVNPDSRNRIGHGTGWKGEAGLAEDVRYYGKWIHQQASERLRHLYPSGPNGESVLAYQWARTVKCPNPSCGYLIPLATTFTLSIAKNWAAYLVPVVDKKSKIVNFEIKHILTSPQPGTIARRGAQCIVCGTTVPFDYLRSEARSHRMSSQMLAVLAHNKHSRVWLDASAKQEEVAQQAVAHDVPDTLLPEQALGFRVQAYGMLKHRDLFSPRQLAAMEVFSDLVKEVGGMVERDASQSGISVKGIL